VLTALHDADGQLRGYAKVTRDLTERQQFEERLQATAMRCACCAPVSAWR
jgi:hypothetical protein